MKYQELDRWTFPEDKQIAAVNCETKVEYVHQILNGTRSDQSEKAKAVIAELHRLADINRAVAPIKQPSMKYYRPESTTPDPRVAITKRLERQLRELKARAIREQVQTTTV